MIVFNKKIVIKINDQVAKGESVIIKLKPEPEKKEDYKSAKKTVDTVTSGSFETKMHFAQSQVAAQKAALKKMGE